jgi:hypothetical protein
MVEKLASLKFMKNKFIAITIAVFSLCSIASPVNALKLSISELIEGAYEVMGGTYGMGGDSEGTRIPILAPSQLPTDAFFIGEYPNEIQDTNLHLAIPLHAMVRLLVTGDHFRRRKVVRCRTLRIVLPQHRRA